MDYGIQGIQGILAGSPEKPLDVALCALEMALTNAMLAPGHQGYDLYLSITEFFKVAAHYMEQGEVEDPKLRRLISEYCYLNTAPFCVSMDVLWVAGGERDSASYDVLVLDQGEYTASNYRVLEDPLNLKILADRGAYDKLSDMATTAGLDTGERLQLVDLQGDCYRNTLVVPKSAVTFI